MDYRYGLHDRLSVLAHPRKWHIVLTVPCCGACGLHSRSVGSEVGSGTRHRENVKVCRNTPSKGSMKRQTTHPSA